MVVYCLAKFVNILCLYYYMLILGVDLHYTFIFGVYITYQSFMSAFIFCAYIIIIDDHLRHIFGFYIAHSRLYYAFVFADF